MKDQIIASVENSGFGIENLPYGVLDRNGVATPSIAYGTYALDLKVLQAAGVFDDILPSGIFSSDVLNDFIGLGRKTHKNTRTRLQEILNDEDSIVWKQPEQYFFTTEGAKFYMPIKVGDYTDFYSSIEHATNVGKMFRDPDNALLPNWKHIPVGYHGRASSIVVSGTNFHRPKGQLMPLNADAPVFAPSKRVDMELEMGFITCGKTEIGESISIEEAENNIFGMVLFNDWSARDIQKWEYVPLGPFLAKNFCSSISPWIVTMDALEPFRTQGPAQDPQPLEYLQYSGAKGFDIALEAYLQPEGKAESKICSTNFKYMYWNMAQQLAHHTVNGCNIKPGDLMASGTISGPTKDSFGSLLELSWSGKEPLELTNGETRSFMEDSDTITLRGFAQNGDTKISFGEVSGKLLPAKD